MTEVSCVTYFNLHVDMCYVKLKINTDLCVFYEHGLRNIFPPKEIFLFINVTTGFSCVITCLSHTAIINVITSGICLSVFIFYLYISVA
jgi:hypothetical protein